MNEETNPQEQSSPEAAPSPEPSAPAGEPKPAEEFASTLESMGIGNAKKTMSWLGKMMSKGVADGVKLPSISLADPSKKAQYRDFVEKEQWKEPRELLAQRLDSWIRAIESGEDLDEIQEKTEERVEQLESLLQENLSNLYEEIRPIEQVYRAADGFFSNAQVEPGEAVDAWFFNCGTDQLLDPDDRTNFDELADKIRTEYKFFSMKKVYSTMVLPDFPGGVDEIDRLGALGEQYKVQVFADVRDYESFEDLTDQLEFFEGMKGGGRNKQYVALAGNHLMAREKHEFEDDDLYVSPSAMLAGRVYKNDETLGIQESAAGYTKGDVTGPKKDRFRIDRDSAAKMKDLGVIPSSFWDGKVRFMGDWNLCADEGLDTYARIRSEDWIVKNVMHYLNKQAFKNITNSTLSAIQKDLRKFLSDCVGDDKPLDAYKVEVRADEEQRRRHEVDVTLELGFKQSVHHFNVRVKEDESGNPAAELV